MILSFRKMNFVIFRENFLTPYIPILQYFMPQVCHRAGAGVRAREVTKGRLFTVQLEKAAPQRKNT